MDKLTLSLFGMQALQNADHGNHQGSNNIDLVQPKPMTEWQTPLGVYLVEV